MAIPSECLPPRTVEEIDEPKPTSAQPHDFDHDQPNKHTNTEPSGPSSAAQAPS